ncbi:MAG: hypothetical protein OXI50_08655, partial [Gammaproteobacteria bacterium]|nr:hypothetical protein [Gammaproteobacteria bacterium]
QHSVHPLSMWIDGFAEHEAALVELRAFLALVRQLGRQGAEVRNHYGGYFSTMLMHEDVNLLEGVCHGPQYGEDRELRPVGGGLPTAKFYVRRLHHRVRFREALRLLRSKGWLSSAQAYLENVCNCPKCRELIAEYGPDEGFARYGVTQPLVFQRGGRTVTAEYATRESLVNAAHHYMYAKQWEHEVLQAKGIAEIRRELREAAEDLGRRLGSSDVAYLRRWDFILEEF